MDLGLRKVSLFMSDVLALYASLFVTTCIGFWGEFDIGVYVLHAAPFTLIYILWLIILYIVDLYDLSIPVASALFFRRWVGALTLLFLTGIAFFYVFPFYGIAPKTNLLIHIILFGALSYAARRIFVRHTDWRIGLFGLNEREQEEIKKEIDTYQHQGYVCVSLEDDHLATLVAREQIRVVILPRWLFSDKPTLLQMYQSLGRGVIFLDLPAAFEMFARRIPVDSIDERWFLQHLQLPSQAVLKTLKRFFDVVGATLLLMLSSPLWVLFGLLIKLQDGGPIFYTQKRVGFHGKEFSIIKFRTMRPDAESHGVQWATKKDTRATPIGAFLRRTHLDELPQMLNVLRGDLSLVGPRPERPEFVAQLEQEVPHYRSRGLVKPGFTGWAQIKFRYARSVSDSKTKFEYDLYYIKNRSLIMDVLILLKTIQLFFRQS